MYPGKDRWVILRASEVLSYWSVADGCGIDVQVGPRIHGIDMTVKEFAEVLAQGEQAEDDELMQDG